jgi:putative transposase
MHGISSATFYKYKAKFGGPDVSDAHKLKALEDENAKLKKLLAEQMLDDACSGSAPNGQIGLIG